jgi:hypothetical protein
LYIVIKFASDILFSKESIEGSLSENIAKAT